MPPRPCVKRVEIAKRTQFCSKHPVLQLLTTKKFPFFSKANLMTRVAWRPSERARLSTIALAKVEASQLKPIVAIFEKKKIVQFDVHEY
jgi:hypothetical protein